MQRTFRACSVVAIVTLVWTIASLIATPPGGPAAAASITPVSIERGRHLATVIGCTDCHAATFGGDTVYDEPAKLVLWAPNLTRGPGGFLATHDTAAFERAVRHGIGPDGKKLLVMPSWDYAALSDADLADIHAYIASVPPVAHRTPKVVFGPKGPAALASGEIQYDADVLARTTLPAFDTTPSARASYGAYLARSAGCEACHGVHLSGSAPGAPYSDPNLTLITRGWTRANFVTTIRTGMTPSGVLLSDEMPWKVYRHMTDDELHAIFAYLRTLPQRPNGT